MLVQSKLVPVAMLHFPSRTTTTKPVGSSFLSLETIRLVPSLPLQNDPISCSLLPVVPYWKRRKERAFLPTIYPSIYLLHPSYWFLRLYNQLLNGSVDYITREK